MSDYDLGTAHGKVIIENDERESRQTRQALDEISKSIDRLEEHFVALNNVMLQSTTRMRMASKSTVGFNASTKEASKSSQGFAGSVKATVANMDNLKKTAGATNKVLKQATIQGFNFGKNYLGMEKLDLSLTSIQKNAGKVTASILRADTVMRSFTQKFQTLHNIGVNVGKVWGGLGNNSWRFLTKGGREMRATAKAANDLAKATAGVGRSFREATTQNVSNWMNNGARATNKFLLKQFQLKKAMADLNPGIKTAMQVASGYLTIERAARAAFNAKGISLFTKTALPALAKATWAVSAATTFLTTKLTQMLGIMSVGIVRAFQASLLGLGRAMGFVSARAMALGSSLQKMAWTQKALLAGNLKNGVASRAWARSLAIVGSAVGGLTLKLGGLTQKGGLLATALGKSNIDAKVLEDRMLRLGRSVGVPVKAMGNLLSGLRAMGPGLSKMAGGIIRFGTGFAIFNSVFKPLRGQLQKIVIGLQLVMAGFLALGALGSVVMGLVDAVRQLSGVLAAAPALLMGVVAAGITLFGAIKSVSKAFKAGKKDGEEYWEAMEKLPPGMKKVASAVHDLKEGYGKLFDISGEAMFKGFGDQLREIGQGYLPALEGGFEGVGRSFNKFIGGFNGFLREKETIGDVNRIFNETSHIVSNIGAAFKPTLEAFRNFSVVGLEAFHSMSNSASGTMSLLAAYSKTWRDTGVIRKWIDTGIQGFKDLGGIIKNAGGLVKDFFAAMGSTGIGTLGNVNDTLQSWRDSLNDIDKSKALKNFGDRMRSLSQFTGEALMTVFRSIGDVIDAVGDRIYAITAEIQAGFLAAVKTIAMVAGVIAKVLASIPGSTEVIAVVAAWATMFKVIALIIAPIVKLGGLLYGLVLAFRGATAAAAGFAMAAQGAAAKSAILGAVLGRWRFTLLGAQMAMTGFGIAILAVVSAFLFWRSSVSKHENAEKKLAESVQETSDSLRDFTDAVYEAGGAIDEVGIEKLAGAVEGVRNQFKDVADNGGTAWDGFLDGAQQTMKILTLGQMNDKWGDANTGDALTEQAEAARRAEASFAKLNLTSEDVARNLTDKGSYEQMRAQLIGLGEDGLAAADSLVVVRNHVAAVQAVAEKVGPSALGVSNGLQKMGEAGASATDRLEGLKMVLRGLGLLETDAEAAAFEYQEAIAKLGDEAARTINELAPLGEAMMENGRLSARGGENAHALRNELSALGDKFLAEAIAGGDVNQMYKDLIPNLHEAGEAYKLLPHEVEQAARAFGIIPATVETLIALQGTDAVERDLAYISLQAHLLTTDKLVPIHIETQAAVDQLRGLGVEVYNFNAGLQSGEIRLKPGTNVKDVTDGINKYLAENVEVEGKVKPFDPNKVLPPGTPPVSIPIEPKVDPNAKKDVAAGVTPEKPVEIPVEIKPTGGGKSGTGSQGVIQTPKEGTKKDGAPEAPKEAADTVTAPKVVTTTIEVKNTGDVITAVKGVVDVLDKVKDKTATLIVKNADVAYGAVQGVLNALSQMRDKTVALSVKNADVAWGAVQGVLNALSQLKPGYTTRLSVENADVAFGAIQGVINVHSELVQKIEQVEGKFNDLGNTISTVMTKIQTAVNNTLTSISTTFTNAATNARLSGEALGQGFADGITSKAEAARIAARKLAEAAARPLPRSPAKEGPFSGKGWTTYRGASVASGFADGIASGTNGARAVSLQLAEAVSSALEKARTAVGLQVTSFGANRKPGAGGKKYYRDPDVSDADLAKARKEEAEKEAQDAKDAAYRESKKAGANIPEQEKKVAEAKERIAKAEVTLSKAKKDSAKESARESLDTAQRNLTDQERKLQEMRDAAARNPDAALTGAEAGGVAGGLMPSSDRSDYIDGMSEVASRFGLDMVSGRRDEPGSHHNDGSAADFSNSNQNSDEMLAFAEFINANFKPWTKELIYDDPRFSGKQIGDGKNVDDSYYANAGDHTNHVHWAVDAVPEFTDDGGLSAGGAPIKQEIEMVPITDNGDGTWSSTDPEWQKLIQRESGGNFQIVQGIQDANSGGNEASGGFQIAKGTWAAHGGTEFAGTAGEATPHQQAIIAAKIFKESGGAPWGAGMAGREDEEKLRAGIVRGTVLGDASSGGSGSEKTAEEQLRTLRASDSKLDETIKTLENPQSSDEQIIRSLQDLDDRIAITEDPDIRDQLESIRGDTMSDRGMKEYDPSEGASTDPVSDITGIAQNLLGIYQAVESGIEGFRSMVDLLARGFENTSDIGTFVDGIQGLVGAVTGVIDTAASIADTVASLAALAGAAIPGVGQVTGAISAVTGGIGQVQAIVDLVQEVGSVIGRWVGMGLSALAGGVGGPLQGDVKMLLDTNDQTLKRWSSDNAMDKRSSNLDPFDWFANKAVSGSGTNQFNIYANPNAPASEIINEAMYAVRTANVGAYSE